MTFIDIRNLQERRQQRDSQFEGTRDIRNGYLFEVNGSVAGDRDGLVWFKAIDENSEPFQVFYNGVIGDLRSNMFVKIERNPKEPARWQIIEFDTGIYFDDQSTYEQLPSLSMIPAKEDYEWPPGFPGAKALNIFPRAITDFAVRPTSPASMKARVYSGIYPGATNYARFQGPVNTKDFTADVPGAGLARLAAISIDNTGTLNYTNGSTFVDGLPMPDAALPAVTASQMLISAVRLVNGMTAIEESNFDLEMRPMMANGTVNLKVSEVWESDFGDVALQSDATGKIGIGDSAPDSQLVVFTDVFVGPSASSGNTSNSFQTTGITLNQVVDLEEIIATKLATVVHGITDETETDTYGAFNPIAFTGGLKMTGLTEIDVGILLRGIHTNDDTGKTSSDEGSITLSANKKSGTGIGSVGADANLLALKDFTATKLIIDAEGTIHQIPGSDIDIDLITAQVTGTPTFGWDESQDQFDFSKGANFNGDVGIGIASPTQKFHVFDTASFVARFEANSATAFSGFQNQADDSAKHLNAQMFGGSFAGTQFGIARADTGSLFSDGCLLTFGTKGNFDLVIGTNNIERMRIDTAGNVGIGTTPQGKLHGYDTISGFEHWKYDGLDGTSRTIVPNGTGDVLYRMTGLYVLRDSAGAVASGQFSVSNASSTPLTVGTNTVTIAVSAAGAATISRTAGSDTIKVGL